MLDYLLLPFVLWVAVAAAVADFRTGKIPNRLLLIGLLFGVEALFALFVWQHLGGPGQSVVMREAGAGGYLLALSLNGALSFLIGLALWWLGVWAAGDAKLFALLAFLTPHGFYSRSLVDVFPAFVLFFNTFFCLMSLLLVELFGKLLVRALRPGERRAAADFARRAGRALVAKGWSVLRVIGGFVAIFMAIRVVRHFARDAIGAVVSLNRTLVYVVLFALFAPLARVLARPRVFAGAVAGIVAYTLYAFGLASDPELRRALVEIGWMSASIVLLGWLYTLYSNSTDVRSVPVSEVRPGMLLSASFLRSLRENSRFNNERMGAQRPDGLSSGQVETLRTWYERHDPQGADAPVELATTVPFAPAMLLAVIATVLLRGYILEIG